jgi:hypothetical protein
MNTSFLATLLCSVAATIVAPITCAGTPAYMKQIERYVRCFNDMNLQNECKANLPNQNTAFARVARGYVMLGKYGSEEKQAENRKQAVADFSWAAEQGYPLGIEAMSIASSDDPHIAMVWMRRAIEHGMGGAAQYLMRRHPVGNDLEESVDLTFYSWVGCHPASFQDLSELYKMWEFGKQSGISDFQTIVAGYRARNDEIINGRSFERCAKGAEYFSYKLSKEQVREGRRRAREKLRQTLQRIRSASEKFPELRFFTRPEYWDLLPEIDATVKK